MRHPGLILAVPHFAALNAGYELRSIREERDEFGFALPLNNLAHSREKKM